MLTRDEYAVLAIAFGNILGLTEFLQTHEYQSDGFKPLNDSTNQNRSTSNITLQKEYWKNLSETIDVEEFFYNKSDPYNVIS